MWMYCITMPLFSDLQIFYHNARIKHSGEWKRNGFIGFRDIPCCFATSNRYNAIFEASRHL